VQYSIEFGKVLSRIIVEENVTGASLEVWPFQPKTATRQCTSKVGLVAIPPTTEIVGFTPGGS